MEQKFVLIHSPFQNLKNRNIKVIQQHQNTDLRIWSQNPINEAIAEGIRNISNEDKMYRYLEYLREYKTVIGATSTRYLFSI